MSADTESQYPTSAQVDQMVDGWKSLSAKSMLEDIEAYDGLYGATTWEGRAEAMDIYKSKLSKEKLQCESVYDRAGIADMPEVFDELLLWWRQHSTSWRMLFGTIPGWPMLDSPRVGHAESWEHEIAESGSIWLARSAGISRVLRAAGMPDATMDGSARRDARDALMISTWRGFPRMLGLGGANDGRYWLVPDPNAIWRRERALLQAAIRINHDDSHPMAVLRTWMIARWLHVSDHSEDLELARTGSDLPVEVGERDLLDPRWFAGFDSSQYMMDFAMAFAAAMAVILGPTVPSTTAFVFGERLKIIAKRQSSETERLHERARLDGQSLNSLSWPPQLPLGAPMLARYVLTQWNVPWLGDASDEAFAEVVRAFDERPSTYEWLALAVLTQRLSLVVDAARIDELVSLWNKHYAELSPHKACLMAASLMRSSMSGIDERALLDCLDRTEAKYIPWVLSEIGRSANGMPWNRHGWMDVVFFRLYNTVKDEGAAEAIRRSAALAMLRQYEDIGKDLRPIWRPTVFLAMADAFVQRQEGLMRDVRRLGLREASEGSG
jgi:hypothetical protein